MRSWFTGDDDRPGLEPERDHDHEWIELRCANCQMPIERVSIAVLVPPFTVPLVVCSELCEADLKASMQDGAA